jgi:adenosyl cobinamide kinase/adenosyl cobinamide phosphate guanylyltransferase
MKFENPKPEFLVVGTAKSGTSFLAKDYLCQHPNIFLPNSNEFYFFSNLRDFCGPYDQAKKKLVTHDAEDYFDNFQAAQPGQKIGEVATEYLYCYKEAIPNIKKYLGEEVKIIIILRDPIKRAFSHYRHMVTKREEPLDFREAIEAQKERKEKRWRLTYQYTELSKYYEQVKAYRDNFKQVKVLIFEDLVRNPKAFINEIYDFLEVPRKHFENIQEKRNVRRPQKNRAIAKVVKLLNLFSKKLTGKPSLLGNCLARWNEKKVELSEKDIQRLKPVFDPEKAKLEKLLGRDLSFWT